MRIERNIRPPEGGGSGKGVWSVIGILNLWLIAATWWQKGWGGLLDVFLLTYMLGLMVAGALLVRHLLLRHAWSLLAVGFLASWFVLGGSYAPLRDAVLGVGVALAVLLSFAPVRLLVLEGLGRLRGMWWRLRRWPALLRAPRKHRRQAARVRLARMRQARFERLFPRLSGWMRRTRADPFGSAVAVKAHFDAAGSGDSTTPATTSRPEPMTSRPMPGLPARAVVLAALAVWGTLSVADRVFAPEPLPLRGVLLNPPGMAEAHRGLRVGLALSGGGYRAALAHAGVVDALGQLGVPVTHLSAVSGGSIIGAYLAEGGAPGDFLQAVIDGRMSMLRELLAAPNLLRLPSPARVPWLDVDLWPVAHSFTRLDVQAGLVHRVLLASAPPADVGSARGPALMTCMTDLNHGLSVGAMAQGIVLAGPTAARFFRKDEGILLDALPRLADQVAVSGAFPGAFPALSVTALIANDAAHADQPPRMTELPLRLADGGVRDNLGLHLLQAADRLAREAGERGPPAARGTEPVSEPRELGRFRGFDMPSDWVLDVILVSDGGQFFKAETADGLLSNLRRAIDLSGLETGVLRPVAPSPQPLVLLSALTKLAASPDAVILGDDMAARRDQAHAYFRPQLLDDAVLERIVALHPQQDVAQAALLRYRASASPGAIELGGLADRCADGAVSSDTAECAWWGLVSLVGDDIWATLETFAAISTLDDRIPAVQARAVFRFGQYLALLNAPEIARALEQARE